MSIVNQAFFYLMISQVIIYVLQAVSFLFKPFNKPQKYFNQLLSRSGFQAQLNSGFFLLAVLMIVKFMDAFNITELDKKLIGQHLDSTSLEVTEDREDLYRNERNMYIFGTAIVLCCANLRYMIHLKSYYDTEDKVKFLTKAKKVL